MAKQVTTDLNIGIEQLNQKLDKLIKDYSTLKGTIDKTKDAQKRYAEEAAKTNTIIKNAKTELFNYAKSFVGIVAAIALLRRTVSSVVTTIKEFEASVANLSAITGAAGKELDFYRRKAIEMSKASTLSAREVVEAYKLVGSAVPELLKNKEALAEVTEKAIILSEAAGIDLPTAAKALGETLNQFRLDARESARVINALAAASQKGAKEIPFVNDALSKFGGVAESAGVGIESSIAAVETLGKVIPQAEIVGTNLRGILITLQTEAENSGRKFNSLSEELELLAPDMSNITKLTKIFGDRNLLAIQTLIKSREEMTDLEQAIKDTSTAYEQAEINTSTIEAKQKKLTNAWKNFILTLDDGTSVIGVTLKGVLDGLSSQINTLGENAQKMGLYFKVLFDTTLSESEVQDIAARIEGLATESEKNLTLLTNAVNENKISFEELSETIYELFPDDIAQKIIKNFKKTADEAKKASESEKEQAMTIKELKAQIKGYNDEIDNTAANEKELAPLIRARNALQKKLNDLLDDGSKKAKKYNDEMKRQRDEALAEEERILVGRLAEEKEFLDKVKAFFEEQKEARIESQREAYKTEEKILESHLDFVAKVEKAAADKRYEDAMRQQEAEKALKEEAFASAVDLAHTLFEVQANNLAKQQQYEIEAVENSNLNEEQKAKKIDEINKKYAEQQKQIAIKQATIDFAQGVIKIWAEYGWNPIIAGLFTALLGAQYGANLALINSQSFAKGGFTGKGFFRDDTGENVTGIVHEDEFVFDKHKTKKHRKLFEDIHSGKVDADALVSAARKYEENQKIGFAQNVANSMLMGMNLKKVENSLYKLRQKGNKNLYLLKEIAEHLTEKEYHI